MRLSPEEKKLRTMRRAQKLQKFIDPAAAANQVSVYDAGNGATAQLRQAERENKSLRLLEQLLAEQQQTNALLQALLAAQQPAAVPYTGGR